MERQTPSLPQMPLPQVPFAPPSMPPMPPPMPPTHLVPPQAPLPIPQIPSSPQMPIPQMPQPQSMPCDPYALKQMCEHMKLYHRYEKQMLKWYMKQCKHSWNMYRKSQRQTQYMPSSCCESSGKGYESGCC